MLTSIESWNQGGNRTALTTAKEIKKSNSYIAHNFSTFLRTGNIVYFNGIGFLR